ncbi:MAG: dihydroorotate dehydrogenase, partial [Nocardioidaceae bacterium]|nr:dihydroorotate dehydrogenase [Nocardioidaceae bacterium]
MTDLTTHLRDLVLPTPVLTAAGCAGPDLATYVDLADVGAVVTRTVTPDPVAGAPAPRLVETAAGLLSAVGDQNAGLAAFLATELPWYAREQLRVVVSIAGDDLTGCRELA